MSADPANAGTYAGVVHPNRFDDVMDTTAFLNAVAGLVGNCAMSSRRRLSSQHICNSIQSSAALSATSGGCQPFPSKGTTCAR